MRRACSLVLLLLVVPLAGFTNFGEVSDVCPACGKPTKDVVVLKSIGPVWCNVIAENDDYYVVERFGEVRAALKSEVESVRWGSGRSATSLEKADQILLKNNLVYNGQILSEDPGRFFTMQCPNFKQTPWVNMVKSVHKAGQPYAFAAPLPPKVAPAAQPTAAPAKSGKSTPAPKDKKK
jgi:hypothetical protein